MANRIEPQPIADFGWVFKERCRCGGTLKYKYTNPNYPNMLLIWMPSYRHFKIEERNKTKVPVTKIELLEETLRQL